MANEIKMVENTEVEEMVANESGVEETQKKRKFDVEKTVDFIVNKRVNEKVEVLKVNGMFTDEEISKIAKQLKSKVKIEVQKEREEAKKTKDEEISKFKTLCQNDSEVLKEAIKDIEVDTVTKEALLFFINNKLENAILRQVGLIK